MIYKDISCIGILDDTSNFDVRFSDEMYDFVWCERDPEVLKTWEDVCDYMISYCKDKFDLDDGKPLEVWEIESDM